MSKFRRIDSVLSPYSPPSGSSLAPPTSVPQCETVDPNSSAKKPSVSKERKASNERRSSKDRKGSKEMDDKYKSKSSTDTKEKSKEKDSKKRSKSKSKDKDDKNMKTSDEEPKSKESKSPAPCQCCCSAGPSRPNRTITIYNPSLELQEKVMRGEFSLDYIANDRRDRDSWYDRRSYSRNSFYNGSEDTWDRYENRNRDRRYNRDTEEEGTLDQDFRDHPNDHRDRDRRYERRHDPRDRGYNKRPDFPDRGRGYDRRQDSIDRLDRRYDTRWPDSQDRFLDDRETPYRDRNLHDRRRQERGHDEQYRNKYHHDPTRTQYHSHDRKDSNLGSDPFVQKQHEHEIKKLRTELEHVKKTAMVLIQRARQKELEEEQARQAAERKCIEDLELKLAVTPNEEVNQNAPPENQQNSEIQPAEQKPTLTITPCADEPPPTETQVVNTSPQTVNADQNAQQADGSKNIEGIAPMVAPEAVPKITPVQGADDNGTASGIQNVPENQTTSAKSKQEIVTTKTEKLLGTATKPETGNLHHHDHQKPHPHHHHQASKKPASPAAPAKAKAPAATKIS